MRNYVCIMEDLFVSISTWCIKSIYQAGVEAAAAQTYMAQDKQEEEITCSFQTWGPIGCTQATASGAESQWREFLSARRESGVTKVRVWWWVGVGVGVEPCFCARLTSEEVIRARSSTDTLEKNLASPKMIFVVEARGSPSGRVEASCPGTVAIKWE